MMRLVIILVILLVISFAAY
ncbi:type I toxin-antitoxin system Ibs family toxin [Pluralibacter gergoviae]|nr:type I toxin-antitoxin system Ibs family toxin [Pluralibacter gergoviae]